MQSTARSWLLEGPTSPGRPEHTTNSDLAACLLLSMSKALFQPMPMCCVLHGNSEPVEDGANQGL